eukprot:s129_g33.t1
MLGALRPTRNIAWTHDGYPQFDSRWRCADVQGFMLLGPCNVTGGFNSLGFISKLSAKDFPVQALSLLMPS